jgi:hypothetical protein
VGLEDGFKEIAHSASVALARARSLASSDLRGG